MVHITSLLMNQGYIYADYRAKVDRWHEEHFMSYLFSMSTTANGRHLHCNNIIPKFEEIRAFSR